MSKSTTTISVRSKIKIVLLGDQSTGKTSIIERFVNDTFNTNQDPTVGVDFLGKNITHNNKLLRLQLWDTAGQERFRSLVPNYLRDAVCAVFVFDVTNDQSIQSLTKWVELFQDNRAAKSVSVLCGNKKDLDSNFDVSRIQKLLSKYPMPFIQVSALKGDNIEQMFSLAIEQLTSTEWLEQQKVDRAQITPVVSLTSFKLPESLPTAEFKTNHAQVEPRPQKRCC